MMVRRMDDDALMVGMGAEPHAWRSRCSYWRDTLTRYWCWWDPLKKDPLRNMFANRPSEEKSL